MMKSICIILAGIFVSISANAQNIQKLAVIDRTAIAEALTKKKIGEQMTSTSTYYLAISEYGAPTFCGGSIYTEDQTYDLKASELAGKFTLYKLGEKSDLIGKNIQIDLLCAALFDTGYVNSVGPQNLVKIYLIDGQGSNVRLHVNYSYQPLLHSWSFETNL
jgi:hypothetical protein